MEAQWQQVSEPAHSFNQLQPFQPKKTLLSDV